MSKAYRVYIDGLLFPVAPTQINEKIVSKNKVYSLVNGNDFNVLKEAGLTEFEFDLLLPNVQYPFAEYKDGYQSAIHYLDKLAELKASKKSFKLVIMKMGTAAKVKMYVSLESYTIKDDAANGTDVVVSVVLKEYINAGTKIYAEKKKSKKKRSETKQKVTAKKGIHWIVNSGQSLWYIAKVCYGDGNRYKEIYEANKDLIDSRNKGLNVPKYTIYANQDLFIPGLDNFPSNTVSAPVASNPIPANQDEKSMKSPGIKYKVKKGDTLRSIARHFYEDDFAYTILYDENQALIDRLNTDALASHNRTDPTHPWYSVNDLPNGKFTIWTDTIITIPWIQKG